MVNICCHKSFSKLFTSMLSSAGPVGLTSDYCGAISKEKKKKERRKDNKKRKKHNDTPTQSLPCFYLVDPVTRIL